MSKYKLVPIEPTQEMIDKGRTARTHPRERYKAMLAAAPAVEQAPEVAKLVEALEEMIDVAKRVDSWECFPSDPIERAEDALALYRQQRGKS